MAFEPTEAQKKIYEFVESGSGNGIIDAVAGAGKTTTLMGCVDHIKNLNDVIYCAFNTSIRKEIQKKFKEKKAEFDDYKSKNGIRHYPGYDKVLAGAKLVDEVLKTTNDGFALISKVIYQLIASPADRSCSHIM